MRVNNENRAKAFTSPSASPAKNNGRSFERVFTISMAATAEERADYPPASLRIEITAAHHHYRDCSAALRYHFTAST